MLLSADYEILVRASRDVSDNFPQYSLFNATWALIATWHNVTFYGANTTPYPVRPVTVMYYSTVFMGISVINVKKTAL